jgi:5-methylcytosine-specific restriction endonuclease McrA
MTKTCSKCNTEKSLVDFANDSKGYLKRKSRCRICIKQSDKERRLANLEEARRKGRESSLKNYYKNPSRVIANNGKYRAAKRSQTPEMSPLEKSAITGLYLIAQILSNSCGEQFHLDHIHPISKGGLHCLDNLQILSAEENLKKGASLCH